jgi:hypothetical protein
MKSALNHTIRNRMVTMEEKESYEGFCRQVKSIADRLAELKGGRSSPTTTEGSLTKTANNEADNAMDWETTVTAVQTRRAKWVDSSVIEQRKKEGNCFRCGAKTHKIKACPYLPAQRPSRPAQKDARKAKVAHVDLDGAELEEESPADEKAEKE